MVRYLSYRIAKMVVYIIHRIAYWLYDNGIIPSEWLNHWHDVDQDLDAWYDIEGYLNR